MKRYPSTSKLFFMAACTLMLTLLMSSYALAHRVSVFAYVEGDKIFTESYFSKKKRVHNGKIEIFKTSDGKLVLSGTTDSEGNFNFEIPKDAAQEKSGLKIVLHASEGHRGEWTIEANEIFTDSKTEQTEKVKEVIEEIAEVKQQDKSAASSSVDAIILTQKINEIDVKVETIKRLLINQQEKGPGVHEIFSGIGYILGLFGIAAFFTSRKK